MRTIKFFLPVLILILSGCATIGEKYSPAPTPPEHKSLAYLFRSNVGFGNFWITNFLVDGEEVVSLYDSGYSWVYLTEGEHSFAANTPTQNKLKFDAPIIAGRTYYIEYTQESVEYNSVRNIIRMVSPKIGKSIIKDYSYKKAKQ